MLPGLDERLRKELQCLMPASSVVKVHASPYRLHAAFRGAGVLSTLVLKSLTPCAQTTLFQLFQFQPTGQLRVHVCVE